MEVEEAAEVEVVVEASPKVEEGEVGVKRRRADEEVEDVEVEEEVAVKKRRADEEVEESPLAKKGRLDGDVDNLPASLLSLSDDVILGVLRWTNINNP